MTKDGEFLSIKEALQDCRYLLVTPIPWYINERQDILIDRLWYHDLIRHLDYITHLTILAPRINVKAGKTNDLDLIEVGAHHAIEFAALPAPENFAQAVFALPKLFSTFWNNIRKSDLVQSGVAGWPLPLGFIANPISVFLRRPLIIIIESAFWRLSGCGPFSYKQRLRASVTEWMARWSVQRARLAIFTHQGYLAELGEPYNGRAIINPAAWIDESSIMQENDVETVWDAKKENLAFLYAARLHVDKGIDTLIRAIKESKHHLPRIDIIGDGPLKDMVGFEAARLGPTSLRLLNPAPYGPEFFSMLRDYHALISPLVSDEQPRVLFDAFSQAVPVIASDSPGQRPFIENDKNGWLFPVGDWRALSEIMSSLRFSPERLRAAGIYARAISSKYTHESMHLQRARSIYGLFERFRC